MGKLNEMVVGETVVVGDFGDCIRYVGDLQKKLGDIERWWGHEVDEIILSLDRPQPNIKMALNRAKNLKTYLGKLDNELDALRKKHRGYMMKD